MGISQAVSHSDTGQREACLGLTVSTLLHALKNNIWANQMSDTHSQTAVYPDVTLLVHIVHQIREPSLRDYYVEIIYEPSRDYL